jgi:hypothetical protein
VVVDGAVAEVASLALEYNLQSAAPSRIYPQITQMRADKGLFNKDAYVDLRHLRADGTR